MAIKQIKILDSIHCQANKAAIDYIADLVRYKKTIWVPGPFAAKKKTVDSYMINRRNGIFLSGYYPRIVKAAKKDGEEIETIGEFEKRKATAKPKLDSITLRTDQQRLVDSAIKKQRGILLSPTGSGKTVLAMSIMKAFPNDKILFLCHSLSILEQTKTEFEKFGFKNICFVGSGNKEINGDIVLASISTFSKLDLDKYSDYFDLILLDEAHHCSALNSMYGKVLQHNLSPIKLGLTATLPEEHEKRLVMEGLIGPVIEKVTIQEGVNKGMLAKPKITFINTGELNQDYRTYNEIYSYNIVYNENRNTIIIKEMIKRIRKNKTVLIMIKNIDHGDELIRILNSKFPKYKDAMIFIQGKTDSEIREQIKIKFDDKKIKSVVCTSVWGEGTNVRTLDCVMLAGGGKGDILVAQNVGRVLRITESKKEAEIVDFLDECKYLSNHCIKRLKLYKDNAWI